MNSVAIVILHHQDPSNMIVAIQSYFPIILSYDTPTDEEWKQAISLQSDNIKITRFDRNVEGFFAGANRNNGLLAAMKNYPKATHFFFFDGDRVPKDLDTNYIDELLQKYNADCCLFICENNDPRAIARTYKLHGLVDTGSMVSDFYSCGFVISKKACDRILSINNGYLFRPEFNGIWGEEDKFLGIQLDNEKFTTIFSSKPKLGGKPLTNADFVKDYSISLQRRIDLMRKFGYELRPFDKYIRLKIENNIPISVYIG